MNIEQCEAAADLQTKPTYAISLVSKTTYNVSEWDNKPYYS